jgi:fido (protein-threonine AMPylation protein)
MIRARDEQEMRNGVEVTRWIEHLAAHSDVPIDLNLICHFNRLILHRTDKDYWAGRLRAEVDWQEPKEWARPRAIVALDEVGLAVVDQRTGEPIVSFPPDAQVKPMLDRLLEWLASPGVAHEDSVIRAAIFHQQFTRIHPFRDGNGRTARALTTLLLRRAGFGLELLVLQRLLDERREVYIASLREADRGDLTHWIAFFVATLADALAEVERLIST